MPILALSRGSRNSSRPTSRSLYAATVRFANKASLRDAIDRSLVKTSVTGLCNPLLA